MKKKQKCHTCEELAANSAGYCDLCWEKIVIPAYAHVESLVPDDAEHHSFYGYAVREAFIAGAKQAMKSSKEN